MSESDHEAWLSEELTEELAETAATLTRLGVTLAGLPAVLLPRDQRERARQLTEEALRYSAVVPRTLAALLREASEEPSVETREDLGARLRRARREQLRAERRQARASEVPADEDDAPPADEAAGDEAEEAVQEAWNEPPVPEQG